MNIANQSDVAKANAKAVATQMLSSQIQPMLHGMEPDVQGGALADLVALFIAGHHPDIRALAEADWLTLMRALVPLNEKALLAEYGGKWPEVQ